MARASRPNEHVAPFLLCTNASVRLLFSVVPFTSRQGRRFCPMKISHKCGMDSYPSMTPYIRDSLLSLRAECTVKSYFIAFAHLFLFSVRPHHRRAQPQSSLWSVPLWPSPSLSKHHGDRGVCQWGFLLPRMPLKLPSLTIAIRDSVFAHHYPRRRSEQVNEEGGFSIFL